MTTFLFADNLVSGEGRVFLSAPNPCVAVIILLPVTDMSELANATLQSVSQRSETEKLNESEDQSEELSAGNGGGSGSGSGVRKESESETEREDRGRQVRLESFVYLQCEGTGFGIILGGIELLPECGTVIMHFKTCTISQFT